jgi:predicted phosphodiesterase
MDNINNNNNIKIYNVTVPITKSELTLRVTGDWHYGLRGVDKDQMMTVLKREQDQHRGNQFILYTGDLIENNLNNSVGHGYDIEIRDPATQIDITKNALKELQSHLYGVNAFRKLSTKRNQILSAGVLGNHEYRSRDTAGIWLQEQLYGPAKILDMKVGGLINLRIVNKKLRLEKTYRIYLSHRPNKSNASTLETMMRAMRKKKADIPADIYVYGHYHRRVIYPDGKYDSNGVFQKVLYAVNPSPIIYVEYADWAGFSPLNSAWYMNLYLPIDKNLYPYGKV